MVSLKVPSKRLFSAIAVSVFAVSSIHSAVGQNPFKNPSPDPTNRFRQVSVRENQSCGDVKFSGCDPCDECCGGLFRSRCESRGTLLQWSYSEGVSGGPDLDEPIVTDRPDFTEASSTVGRGVAQLEMGYTYNFDDNSTTTSKSHSYPETLLRYGILDDWLEFRTAWNYANEESAGVSTSGSEDLYLGFKIGLTPQEGILPEMALVPQMTVPTGANAFTADEALPGLNWLYGWDINDFISTAGSTQFNRTIDDGTGDAYTEWAQSWTAGYSLSDKVGAYTEYFGLFPTHADTARPEHYFNGGFTYLISNDVQWDIRAGTGLNDAADDYFVGTGLSIRVK